MAEGCGLTEPVLQTLRLTLLRHLGGRIYIHNYLVMFDLQNK